MINPSILRPFMRALDWRLSAREWAAKVMVALQNRAKGQQSVLDDEILEAITEAIESRRLSQLALTREMLIRRSSFRQSSDRVGITIAKVRRGPILLCDPDDARRRPMTFAAMTYLMPGYKRLAMSITPEGLPPLFNEVYQIAHALAAHKTPEKLLHTKSFSAKDKDYLWHTDLHEIKSQPVPQGGRSITYMIAFMDDATRFIVGWELIPDKTAATCANVLARILETQGIRPGVLESDNGGEFKGDMFVTLLKQMGIRTWYTVPHTTAEWKNRALLADYGRHDR
jgi:transposase InsO family protein